MPTVGTLFPRQRHFPVIRARVLFLGIETTQVCSTNANTSTTQLKKRSFFHKSCLPSPIHFLFPPTFPISTTITTFTPHSHVLTTHPLTIPHPLFLGLPFPIKLGDCFRLGSVGLVVSEMRTADGGDDQRLDNKTLQYLKDEALEFEAVRGSNNILVLSFVLFIGLLYPAFMSILPFPCISVHSTNMPLTHIVYSTI